MADLLEQKTGRKVDTGKPCSRGWRNVLLDHGPKEFAKRISENKSTLITDTTWRDGQQSLLATRVRTKDLAAIATCTSHAYSNAYSLESKQCSPNSIRIVFGRSPIKTVF
jgi:pyruvate carboxylase